MNKLTNKRFKIFTAVISIVLIYTVIFFTISSNNSLYGEDLMAGVKANEVESRELDSEYIKAVTNFSIELFKQSQTDGVNSLISPVSAYISLAMIANGADGDTLKQFEDVLGNGMSINDINKYTYSIINNLPDESGLKIKTINSIWFDKGSLNPVKSFLQQNADYFNADIFKINLRNEKDSLNRINTWIKDKTDGAIENVIDEIDDQIMLLINTMFFDGEWLLEEFKHNIEDGIFYMSNNLGVKAEFMNSYLSYIKSDNATGFICPYKKDYSFVALLPEFDVKIEEYIKSLSGEEFLNIVDFETDEKCVATMPKFKYEYCVDLKDSIYSMEINGTDFPKLGRIDKRRNSVIGKMYSKTNIEVNEERTIVGTSTATRIYTTGGIGASNYVDLNRPFVYAIIENNSKIPLFIGSVNSIEGETFETENPPKGHYITEDNNYQYELFYSPTASKAEGGIIKYIGTETSITISDSFISEDITYMIHDIRDNAFNGNKIIENVKIDKYFSYLGNNAFAYCPNLKDVYFYGDVYEIGNDVFKGSGNVIIHCPEYASKIREYAEKNGLNIEIIELPDDEDIKDIE